MEKKRKHAKKVETKYTKEAFECLTKTWKAEKTRADKLEEECEDLKQRLCIAKSFFELLGRGWKADVLIEKQKEIIELIKKEIKDERNSY